MSFLGLNLFNRIAIWIDSKNSMFLLDFLDIDYCRGSQTLFAWQTQILSLKISQTLKKSFDSIIAKIPYKNFYFMIDIFS